MRNLSLFWITITLMAVTHSGVYAQWSTAPGIPLALTDSELEKSKPLAVGDGQGGMYVVWMELSFGEIGTRVLGQHLNADGFEQWTLGGQELVPATGQYYELAPSIECLPDGDFLLCWSESWDLNVQYLMMQRFSSDGAAVWAQPSAVGGFGGGYIDARGTSFITNGTRTYIAFDSWTGSVADIRLCRVDLDGSVSWGYNGILVDDTATLGDIRPLVKDGTDGGYVVWPQSENPGEETLVAQRFRSDGGFVWTGPATINLDGPSDFPNQGPVFGPVGASDLIAVWNQPSGPIMAARMDSTGILTWTTPNITVYDGAFPGIQPQISIQGEEVVIAYRVLPPPYESCQVLAQRYSGSGFELWSPNGTLALSGTPYPDHVLSAGPSNRTLVFTEAAAGWSVQRISEQGTWDVAVPLVLVDSSVSSEVEQAFASHVTLGSAIVGAVRMWRSDADSDIGVFRVEDSDFPLLIDSRSVSAPYVHVGPNPADESCLILMPDVAVERVQVYDAIGHMLKQFSLNGTKDNVRIWLGDLANGAYIVEVINGASFQRMPLIVDHSH